MTQPAVFTAQNDAEKEKFLRAAENKDGIFKLARKLKAENVDIAGDKCVWNRLCQKDTFSSDHLRKFFYIPILVTRLHVKFFEKFCR